MSIQIDRILRSGHPSSEVFPRRNLDANTRSTPEVRSHTDDMSVLAEQWLTELDGCESSLDALSSSSATFKSELNAIETWFSCVLSEPERTAALYTLLQHTTQVQIRFFMTVLREMEVKRLDPGMARAIDSDSKVGIKRTQQQPTVDAKRASLSRENADENDTEILDDAPRAISPIGSEKSSASRSPSLDPENSPPKPSAMPAWDTPSKQPAGWQSSLANAEIMASTTAMKLAALSTVNNRIILDSDVRKFRRRNLLEQTSSSPLSSPFHMSSPMMYNETGQVVPVPAHMTSSPFPTRSRHWQSPASSLFSSPAVVSPATPLKPTSPELQYPGLGMGLQLASPFSDWYSSPVSAPAQKPAPSPSPSTTSTTSSSSTSKKASSSIPDEAQLNDIPSWLRSLRLHKYTDNLKDLTWDELVLLSEDDLIARGVSALGARRKMLKVFESVKAAKE